MQNIQIQCIFGEAAPDVLHTIPETIQETRPEPDQSQEHIPTPPRPTTSDQIPPVFEQGHTSDPNIAAFSGAHKSDPDLFTSTNVEDEKLGGSYHTTPPRSTPVPPVGPTSRGAKDLATLTALSSLVSKLVQKVSTLESELKAHKLLFKNVVGQLVKKVKALELKLKTRSRKAAAASNAHVDVSPGADIPTSPPLPTSDVPPTEVPSTAFPTDVPADGAPTGPSTISPGSTTIPTSSFVPTAEIIPANSGTTPKTPSSPVKDARKGKGVAVDEPTPTYDKTFKQLEEERIARQMSQDFEMSEAQRKRQQEVLAFAVNYLDAAWDIILARWLSWSILEAKELAEQRAQERRERPMTPSQLRQYMRTYLQEEFDKIQRAVAFTRGLKKDGSPMTRASSKKIKTGDDEVNIEAPSHSVPQEKEDAHVEVPSQEATIEDVEQLGRKGVHPSQSSIPIEEGDPEAKHKVCIKYASDADSDSDDDTPVNLYDVVDWELLPTGLGLINVFYRLDNSRKYFTSLREILHLVTRADLMTIYGHVMTFYPDKKAEGVGLVLWGDLKVLMDSPEVNDETVSGLVLHMFVDKKYPFSVNLIERMLDHQLEICHGTVGNELTTAIQLIAFLKKQISDSKRPKVHDWYCCYNKEWLVQEGTALCKDYIKSVNGYDDLPKIIRLASPRVNGYLVKASSNPLLFFDSPLPVVNTPWDVMRIVFSQSAYIVLAVAHSPVSILKLTSEDLSRNLKYVVPIGRVKVPTGRYVVPIGRVKVPTGRYVVPTSKDNVIVSAGRTKVIPAGRTILVLVVLCLLRVDSIVS
ncbi:hypothetical protein Tco_1185783 [Tanacetum coccineum]